MSSPPAPPNETQISTLPGVTRHITGHNPSGEAILESSTPGNWHPLMNNALAFNVIYTTSEFPVSLNENRDIQTHESLVTSKTLGLVNPHGTVCRMVDFAPGTEPLMHRTQSLDYGLVVEGEVEMVLDAGVTKVLRRGDVAVQRATNHGWRNASPTQWARMFFVLQDCQKVVVGGQELGEDLSRAGAAEGEVPASGNDGGAKI